MLLRLLRCLLPVLLFAFLFTGCDQKALLQKIVPKDDDAFARRFFDAVRHSDYAAVDPMLTPQLRGQKFEPGLRELSRLLDHGEPLSMEIIGCNVFTNTTEKGTVRTSNLSYQVQFPDGWVAGNIAVSRQGSDVVVVDSHFQPVAGSLDAVNQFTFAGKSATHYLVLALCIAVPVFIIVVLIVCAKSRVRRKWLWILFILAGLVQFRFDWSSGQFGVQPFAFSLLGASVVRPGPYAPWVLGFSIPVGAVLFLLLRRRLVMAEAARKSSGALPPPLMPA